MALPNNMASSVPVRSAWLAPDDVGRTDLLIDYELGGVGLNDPSEGLQVQTWEAWSDGVSVWAAPSPSRTPATLLLTGTAITEVSIAFDQNMHATLAYVDGGVTKLYWYDTIVPGMVVTSFTGASSPMICMDDKREGMNASNDILFFYLRSGSIYYRQQRDRYGVERLLGTGVPATVRISFVGMGTTGRMQIGMHGPHSATYTDLLTDTLYVQDGSDVTPLLSGAAQTGLWRSRIFVLDDQPSFAWARVEADYPAILRIYGDGDLVYETPAIISDEPIRLPVARAREWQIEVESATRVIEVKLAGSILELMGAS